MAKNARADETILNPATKNSMSLRTTIPSWIIAKYELKKGDKFRWHLTEKGLIFIETIQEDQQE
jgi:hypothetical protein